MYSGHNTPLRHHTDDRLGKYCAPHIVSSVLLILVLFLLMPTFLAIFTLK